MNTTANFHIHYQKTFLLGCFLCLYLWWMLPVANGGYACEKKKIDFLLQQVADSGYTFYRNGGTHDSKSAAGHLNLKLTNALNSWFTPPKENWTAKMFIEKLATASSWTNKPYQIQAPSQNPQPLAPWLFVQLNTFDPSGCRP